MAEIYPSIISANLADLKEELKRLDPYVQGYHIDIMDGNFVPNLTWGPAMTNAIATMSSRTHNWAHLMVTTPQIYIKPLLLAPGSVLTFHFESACDVNDMIKLILEKNWKPSIAIKPKTDAEKVFPFLNKVHQVVVMSVEPGFSGQDFLPESIKKVELLAAYRSTSKLNFRIGIDGGINNENIALLAEKGADDFAVASAIFANKRPIEALKELQEKIA